MTTAGGINMATPILVTGAAGRVGAVGRTVTELLLAQGKAVRAMVRNEDQRAQALQCVARGKGTDVSECSIALRWTDRDDRIKMRIVICATNQQHAALATRNNAMEKTGLLELSNRLPLMTIFREA